MAEKIMAIAKIVLTVLSYLFTAVVPALIVFFKKHKALKTAKTEEERQKIINAMKADAQVFIIEAENMYKTVDSLLKANGGSCGSVKKEGVMSKLRTEAIQKGLEFDEEFWSKTVDELVKMTKEVNRK